MRPILEVLAIVCELLAAFGFPGSRVNLGWLGLALWMLAVFVPFA